MKKISSLALLAMLFVFSAFAQTTITATGYPPNPTATHTFGTSCTPPCAFQPVAITFVVTNTNSYPITVQDVGYCPYATVKHELWYTFSSVTGPPPPIASPTWTWVAVTPTTANTYPTIVNAFFPQVNVIIPPNTSCRFGVVGYENVLMGSSYLAAPNFTSGGVTMSVGTGSSYWGLQTNPTLMNYGYYGSITFRTPICNIVPPANITATAITPTGATLNWTPTTGAASYEYAVDQNPIYFPGTTTSSTTTPTASFTGLTPSTTYTAHIRSRCATDNASEWQHFSFTTTPPCNVPVISMGTPTTTGNVTVTWTGTAAGTSYDYVLDQTRDDPTVSSTIQNLPGTTKNETGLLDGEKYYVHIRSVCGTTDMSGWALDSVTMPVPCRAPVIQVSNINTDEAVLYWNVPATAYGYEYAITKSANEPANGTEITINMVHASALLDGVDYYMHVRSLCLSEGVDSKSPWGWA